MLIRLGETQVEVEDVAYRFINNAAHALLTTSSFEAPGLGKVAIHVEKKMYGKGDGRLEVAGLVCRIKTAHYGSGEIHGVAYKGFVGSCEMPGGEEREFAVGPVR